MNSIQTDWLNRKTELKKDICYYFLGKGLSKKDVAQICQEIKWKGAALVEIARLFNEEWFPIAPSEVDNYFSTHRKFVADWINRYATLHEEALNYLQSQRTWEKSEDWMRDDSEYDAYLASKPKGEIQVHSDRALVISYEYVDGFAESLPKKWKKPLGKTDDGFGYEWEYPLTELDNLKKIGLPVLYAIDCPPEYHLS